MTTQNLTLNDTLEEQLRLQLIEEKQTNDTLRAHITILEKAVKDEQNGKYKAYKRIAELTSELNVIKDLST